jgi:hypothetical protein
MQGNTTNKVKVSYRANFKQIELYCFTFEVQIFTFENFVYSFENYFENIFKIIDKMFGY